MKIKQTLISAVLLIGLAGLFFSTAVFAEDCGDGLVTSVLPCNNGSSSSGNIEDTGLWGLLMTVINIMSIGVGVLAVGGIVYGSIMYTSAGGSPEKSKKARLMITNVIVGLVLYALMFALLNFLVPGGLFR